MKYDLITNTVIIINTTTKFKSTHFTQTDYYNTQ